MERISGTEQQRNSHEQYALATRSASPSTVVMVLGPLLHPPTTTRTASHPRDKNRVVTAHR
jgi:hypothetical protein